MCDEVQVKRGYRRWRLGKAHGVKGEMTGEEIRFVPRERISEGIDEQIVLLDGRWVIVAGGDDEGIKKVIASDGLYSPEASGTRNDAALLRETRAGVVANVSQLILKLLGPPFKIER